MVRATYSSLPGMGLALTMTVSPGTISTQRWSRLAMRARPAIGSPCAPVVAMVSCASGTSLRRSLGTSWPGRSAGSPGRSRCAMFCSIDRPMTATLRPKVADGVEDLLDARDVAGEGGHDDAPLEALHDLAEGLADGPLGGRVAGVLGARRVGQQAQHALRAEAGQRVEVGQLAVHRRVVELEVAGVDDVPTGVRRAMPIASGIEWPMRKAVALERAQLDRLAGLERAAAGCCGACAP